MGTALRRSDPSACAPGANHTRQLDVVREVAHLLGKRPATVRDWLSGHCRYLPRLELIVERLLAGGNRAQVDRMFRRIDALRRGIVRPQLTPRLVDQHVVADADENVLLVDFLQNQCEATARALVRGIDVDMTLDLELREAVVSRFPALAGT